jgi:N-acetylglutamate synthase-like GNAT family acetyltransferase
MIYNKWFRNDDKGKEILSLRRKFKEHMEADFRNMFSYDVVVYEGKQPIGMGRLEMRSGLFMIVGLVTEEQHKTSEIKDLLVRLIIRKACDLGAQGVYVKLKENNPEEISFYSQYEFKIANKNFHEENIFYRHGDIKGNCCEEKKNEKRR